MGQYARVQVDVDCSMDLSEKVLLQGKKAYFDFLANLYYAFVPFFCHCCKTIAHKTDVGE